MSFRPVHATDQSGKKQGISFVIWDSLVYGKAKEERRSVNFVTLFMERLSKSASSDLIA